MTQLTLKNNGEIVSYHNSGSSLFVDGVYVSPAYAGWSYGDYSLIEAPIPQQVESSTPSKEQLLRYAAELRWQKENGGISFYSIPVATDDRSKLMLSGARLAAMSDPEFVTRWKTADGWVDLSASQIIEISNAVHAHVANCFAVEAEVADMIDSGILTTFEDIEAEFNG